MLSVWFWIIGVFLFILLFLLPQYLHARALNVGDPRFFAQTQQRIQEADKQGKKKIILFCTGAFSPIHRDHVTMFQVAKKWLEQQHGYAVVGGIICPSHDVYMIWKLGRNFVSAKHRLEMCRRAIAETDCGSWVTVTDWETNPPNVLLSLARLAVLPVNRYVVSVLSSVDKFCRQTLADSDVEVMFLCGADAAVNGKLNHLGGFRVVAASRGGYDERIESLTDHENIEFVPIKLHDLSSTKLRAQIAKGEDIHEDYDLGLVLVSNSTIRELNRKHRKVDKPTDILSFPLNEPKIPGSKPKPEAGVKDLGDMFIAVPYVLEYCRKHRTTWHDHLPRLVVHGMCHLVGYDHQTPQQTQQMIAREKELLTQLHELLAKEITPATTTTATTETTPPTTTTTATTTATTTTTAKEKTTTT